ncbi:MAG: glycogen/starch/alpha-glucan family phosphorylase, partial [Oscillospiraceae bacterium]
MKTINVTKESFKNDLQSALDRLYTLTPKTASDEQIYRATAFIVRDILENKLRHHDAKAYGEGAKQVCYISMEFLVGRSLKNNLYNLGINKQVEEALADFDVSLDKIYELEPDAGLGNGGLGRLAACYMDALATGGYGATGYSIMYEYGIFKQKITDGWQQETLDNWLLAGGDVWLDEKRNEAVEVRFDGAIKESWESKYHHVEHVGYNAVRAVPWDMYISGHDTCAVSRLRLWKAEAVGIDMDSFNRGDYTTALRAGGNAELISKVLYPNDNHMEGKILRLRQQYFMCCASVNDIVSKHLAQYGTLENLPDKIAVQLNDTHPSLAIPELMRILLDECGYDWDAAFSLTHRTFAYTNHTVLSEALERWNVEMFRSALPRIFQIIEEIDRSLRRELNERFPGDIGKISYMSVIGDGFVRMANLSVYMCHSVNGVSQLHSDIIKEEVFHDYWLFSPEKFTNVTNGIAYRRWLLQSDEGLTSLLCDKIGAGFKKDASELAKFARFSSERDVQVRLAEIKRENKLRLIDYAGKNLDYPINPDSIFDVQAKRLH